MVFNILKIFFSKETGIKYPLFYKRKAYYTLMDESYMECYLIKRMIPVFSLLQIRTLILKIEEGKLSELSLFFE